MAGGEILELHCRCWVNSGLAQRQHAPATKALHRVSCGICDWPDCDPGSRLSLHSSRIWLDLFTKFTFRLSYVPQLTGGFQWPDHFFNLIDSCPSFIRDPYLLFIVHPGSSGLTGPPEPLVLISSMILDARAVSAFSLHLVALRTVLLSLSRGPDRQLIVRGRYNMSDYYCR